MHKWYIAGLLLLAAQSVQAENWISTGEPGWYADADSVTRNGDIGSVTVRSGQGERIYFQFDCPNRFVLLTGGVTVSVDAPGGRPGGMAIFKTACANVAERQVKKMQKLLK
jgi:hypothetical protein